MAEFFHRIKTLFSDRPPDRPPAMAEYDHLIKILLIGDGLTGKTALVHRFAEDSFADSYLCGVAVDFQMRTLDDVDGKVCKLHVWDVIGDPRMGVIGRWYLRGADGVLVVCDVTNQESFDNLETHFAEIDEHVSNSLVKIVLVGNKCDVEEARAVQSERAREFARKRCIPYWETSAKTGHNVTDTFMELTSLILDEKAPPLPLQVHAEKMGEEGCLKISCTNLGGEHLGEFTEMKMASTFEEFLKLVQGRVGKPSHGGRWKVVLPNAESPDRSQYQMSLGELLFP